MRTRVFSLLRRVGVELDGAPTVAAGTTDADAIEQIIAAAPRLLLIPFHAHRDEQDRPLNGLTLCRKLHADARWRRAMIVMPVTKMGAANLRLMATAGPHAPSHRRLVDQRIMVISEVDVEDASTASRLRQRLRDHGLSRA